MSKQVIDNFLEHYAREFDHYSELSRIAQRRIEGALSKHGIQAMVTSRAKNAQRLQAKLRNRDQSKNYTSEASIHEDVIDLAGVRISLYFPTDRDKIGSLLNDVFQVVRDPKTFPELDKPRPGKRFPGYFATHYLVKLKQEGLDHDQLRFSPSRIEIQIASVLMHAWAEVEHDLQYKPETGTLSEDEIAILDELNGLVLSGELALERLQRAVQRRTISSRFANQYELASFLTYTARQADFAKVDVGKVDLLYRVLVRANKNTANGINPFLSGFSEDDKKELIADVIIDKIIISGDEEMSKLVSDEISREESSELPSEDASQAVSQFLNTWKEVEHVLRSATAGDQSNYASFGLVMKQASLSAMLRGVIQEARFVRNQLVHSLEPPPAKRLIELTTRLTEDLLPALKKSLSDRKR